MTVAGCFKLFIDFTSFPEVKLGAGANTPVTRAQAGAPCGASRLAVIPKRSASGRSPLPSVQECPMKTPARVKANGAFSLRRRICLIGAIHPRSRLLPAAAAATAVEYVVNVLERNESAVSFDWLVRASGLVPGSELVVATDTWKRVRDRMRRPVDQTFTFGQDWISDPWVACGVKPTPLTHIAA